LRSLKSLAPFGAASTHSKCGVGRKKHALESAERDNQRI